MSTPDPDNEATFHVCVIDSDQCETDTPKKAILDELQKHRFGEDAQFAVKLALEEALTNAVKHGNLCDTGKQITIKYAVNSDKAVIIIRDEGCGFIPEEIPDPTTPDRLPHPNGRGIMLMRAYMDEVIFRDKGCEVRFVKRRVAGTGANA